MTPTYIPSVCSFIHFDLTSSLRIEIACTLCTLQPVLDFRRKQKEKIVRGKKNEKKQKKNRKMEKHKVDPNIVRTNVKQNDVYIKVTMAQMSTAQTSTLMSLALMLT